MYMHLVYWRRHQPFSKFHWPVPLILMLSSKLTLIEFPFNIGTTSYMLAMVYMSLKSSNTGSWPISLANFIISSGEMAVEAVFTIGCPNIFSWPPLTMSESSMNFTSPALSLKMAKGVTLPWVTPNFSFRMDPSARRSPPDAPTFLHTALSWIGLSWRAVRRYSLFFLSFTKRFLQNAPVRCWICGIIASTVKTWEV